MIWSETILQFFRWIVSIEQCSVNYLSDSICFKKRTDSAWNPQSQIDNKTDDSSITADALVKPLVCNKIFNFQKWKIRGESVSGELRSSSDTNESQKMLLVCWMHVQI